MADLPLLPVRRGGGVGWGFEASGDQLPRRRRHALSRSPPTPSASDLLTLGTGARHWASQFYLYDASSSWLSGVPPAIRPGSASGRALESGRGLGWTSQRGGIGETCRAVAATSGGDGGTCGCLAPPGSPELPRSATAQRAARRLRHPDSRRF